MFSDEASCSECKLELIEKIWTKVLLNWINLCILQNKKTVRNLNARNLVEVINKYKDDICFDDMDRAMLCTDDLEPFIKYKYPILRLRNLSDAQDLPRKLYIMTSILLYHCCCSSQSGIVDTDICKFMAKTEQEVILKFCEKLSDMEATVNNVESAIRDACESVYRPTDEENVRTLATSESDGDKAERSSCREPQNESCLSDSSWMLQSPSAGSASDGQSRKPILKFKSSVTVLPSSIVADTSNYSDLKQRGFDSKTETEAAEKGVYEMRDVNVYNVGRNVTGDDSANVSKSFCKPNCECTNCITALKVCGDPGNSMTQCVQPSRLKNFFINRWKIIAVILSVVILLIIIAILVITLIKQTRENTFKAKRLEDFIAAEEARYYEADSWECVNNLCQKVYQPTKSKIYPSHGRCILLCMGPQIWPHPIGYTFFSKTIVFLATNKLEYRIQSVPSEIVHQYLAEALKLFIGDLARLERAHKSIKNDNEETNIKKMYIQIEVESDPDPRLRLNTEEAYTIKIDKSTQVNINLVSMSFCGVRHALETLSQLIMLDPSTGCLMTLTNVVIKDAPSYRYRGLMIDTARNYIPVRDLMRTIDAMGSCKLNTFHWRISDVTSFPLLIPKLSKLFEFGAYERSKVYTKSDVKTLVKRATVRGIRVLIEVAAPGPVGRPWSWSADATCPAKNENFTCDNVLCLRLSIDDRIFDILETIYAEILDMTNVDDIFHLSDGIFSISNCYSLIEDRLGFLDKALERLKLANRGFLPKLPIIWYTSHLTRGREAMTWERYGVQLTDWYSGSTHNLFSKFKVIHSSKWDLSCEIRNNRCKKYRTWQEMYSWKSWRNVEVFTIEGGEAILWTDLVDTGNLDYHLWPRAAAVAERLWSDIVINSTAGDSVYVRLDMHRWRLLLRAVKVRPLWPIWCSLNPAQCLKKLKYT